MKRFLGIMQFLTRIPIPVQLEMDKEFHKSLVYFPLVGWVLGILYYVLGVSSRFFFSNEITAVFILLGTVILTGGLHIDGVGDTFDGLYSYRDKDRMLEIMKDSRLGTNGLLAIIFILMFKLIFIYHLLEADHIWGVMLMPIYGRINSFAACYKTKTPREKGMGNLFIGKVSPCMFIVTAGYMFIIVFGILYGLTDKNPMKFTAHAVLFFLVLLVNRGFIKSVYKKIDGITGDVLGTICEFSEVMYLAGIYMLITCWI